MRYVGGKVRIATPIAMILQREREREFVSLFCGSCAIESKVNFGTKTINDINPYLIAMWRALQNGWIPPNNITEEEYKYIRQHKDEDMALTGFVGFGCSFGGKWFGGYARNKDGCNYCSIARRSVLQIVKDLQYANFTCLDYKDVPIKDGSVVYADPPYANTTGYSFGKDFNTDEFWEYMRHISKNNQVFISEQNAPSDFECVWQREIKRTLDVNKNNQPQKTEKLFVYRG